ncbi:alpha/beta hydrolase [Lactobacillus helveticus]|uniref:Putative secreted protein n=1 Tax=Lactobacillus helveticus CIRM-BIA 104 TaxID=1226333 RepID=U6F6W7_LACHE|nr:alpha/beta hydrolase [Lactobacillus helveticus]KXN78226.1 hydrolase [Lactobacillus helveticus]CDI59692.1 Putative secreted protein [Lactobacillus helveticus CIRM-BIA 104]
MKKKGIGIISLILIIIIAIVAGIKIKQNHDENAVQEIQPVKVSSKTVPTFFFHGWGSSWHAEDTMAQAIKRAGATNTIVRVNVNKKGHARLIGKIKKNAKNPLVEVNFSDNKLTNSQYNGQYANAYDSTGARYVKNAIDLVRNKYHYSKINIVAHSMGNLEVASYIKLNAGKKNFPQIDHLVAMAGHYDGIIGICGWGCGGGILLNAAANDPRIKATAAITMYDMPHVGAWGYFDKGTADERYQNKKQIAEQRTKEYGTGKFAKAGGCFEYPAR